MRKSRFTEEQIAYALRQVESGVTAKDVCRKMGISEQTFYGTFDRTVLRSHDYFLERATSAAEIPSSARP